MDIRFECWKCHNKIAVDLSGSGLTVPCPVCSQEIVIPAWAQAIEKANGNIREAAVLEASYDAPRLAKKIKDQFHYDGYVCLEEERSTHIDLGLLRRIRLVVEINIDIVNGHKKWRNAMDDDIVMMWPAWELIPDTASRALSRATKRWKANGGKTCRGKLVALKTDPIWRKFSLFDRPWSPFDFNNDLRVKNVDRSEAIELRLLTSGTRLTSLPDCGPAAFIPLESEAVTRFIEEHPEQ